MIDVENVNKSYLRGKTAVSVLRGVTCHVPTGAFSFIVGPSGSGKSTLLYLMGALDTPDSGSIRLRGEDLAPLEPAKKDELRRRSIGFIFQSFNLLPNLDAVDNVLVPFLPTGEAASRRSEAADLLRQVGLGNRLDHRPSELSGGEQQRVAIARALLKRPALILADEPTGELDSATGQEIFEILRRMQREMQTTIVTVTHDHRYIQDSDLVLRIQDGRIVA
ncbi:P-loop containing nucleoside triphosphate hydrolase [Caulifigura coniformis]|uniref:P-loop containing nucleoside triphosphate hydrolase n=1 Tax=Caulifigura coniformis TaxID=2527983 RepID=A0A517SHP3_9PLAN|nr:ABC transporter ATP-binding protein [Caulifigura coniformis]QDT55635.1 P-loop containing nucleoside triphosphate hydrolase [Caulifigura coniformis]